MGFLEYGAPLSWEETKPLIARVKIDGIKQLLHIFQLNRHREDHELKWGDEVEYNLVHFDHANRNARLYANAHEIIQQLNNNERASNWPDATTLGQTATVFSGLRLPFLRGAEWHPEFGNHMVESTPNPPYEFSVESLLDVEDSLLSRRYKIQSLLPPDVYVASLSAFPRLGCQDSCLFPQPPDLNPNTLEIMDEASTELFPRALINPHPRFGTLVKNINARRGTKINAVIPVLRDHHTEESPTWNHALDSAKISREDLAKQSKVTRDPALGQIYMDHFGHGMSLCCLQVTFGTHNMEAARYLYDQMAVLAPLFLSLSAATPMLRGWLAATDARWRVLEQTCDCRTEAELIELKRSRYGVVSRFISTDSYLVENEAKLNDVDVPMDMTAYRQLRNGDMDASLAKHFASLWIRDPVVVFGDRLELDNKTSVDHFENIQSTNWNTVRFKPPPVSHDGVTPPKICWRVELRTPDIQLSDFENAALCAVASLLAMAITKHHWNFYIPISNIIQNMETAHQMSSITKHQFWFRSCYENEGDVEGKRMTMREIFLGCPRYKFVGLIPLLDKFVSEEWRQHRCGRDAVERYRLYANYIKQRVTGQVWCDARLLRHLVRTHPSYQGASEVSRDINYDVCKFAVLGGFSLCPEVSPWGLPRCLPSSFRWPKTCTFAGLAHLPLVQSLVRLLAEGDAQRTAAVLANSQQNQMQDETLDEDQPAYIQCCAGGNSFSVPAIPSSRAVPHFDPQLFLAMDQHSR